MVSVTKNHTLFYFRWKKKTSGVSETQCLPESTKIQEGGHKVAYSDNIWKVTDQNSNYAKYEHLHGFFSMQSQNSM